MFPKRLTVPLVVCEISKYPQDAPAPVIAVKCPTVRVTRRFFIGCPYLVWQMVTTTFSLQDGGSTRLQENAQHFCTTCESGLI